MAIQLESFFLIKSQNVDDNVKNTRRIFFGMIWVLMYRHSKSAIAILPFIKKKKKKKKKKYPIEGNGLIFLNFTSVTYVPLHIFTGNIKLH